MYIYNMTYENVVQWVKRADYDLKTAFAMQDAARYLYVVFMCQQALEKILKACEKLYKCLKKQLKK